MCSRDLNRRSRTFSTSGTASPARCNSKLLAGREGDRRLLETPAVPLPLGADGNIVHLVITDNITANRVAEETIAAQQSQLIHISQIF